MKLQKLKTNPRRISEKTQIKILTNGFKVPSCREASDQWPSQ